MRNKGISTTIIVLAIIVVLGLILASVGLKNFIPPIITTTTTTSSTTVSTTTTQMIANSVVDANNQFAFDLYSKYKSKDGNIFFSPYSISSALAMTYEGARGQTAQEMQNVLHLPGDITKMRSDFVSINNELNKADKVYNLSTANALWAQKDYVFSNEYFENVKSYYGGNATNLDFSSDPEGSRQIINNWVEGKTNDRIKDLIPPGMISSQTKLVLTNAVYFKANWTFQFVNSSTINQSFMVSPGKNVSVEMMHQTEDFNYGETDNFQILELPYLGNDLSMIIILPKGNHLSDVENSITKDNLVNWQKSMDFEKVTLSLPKFKFETKYVMKDDLAAMGMPTAFSGAADFSGMTGSKDLFISEVIHQTFVQVSESGTEAAAATAVIMGTTASPGQPVQPKIFTADHPFIFIIQQKDSGNILFLGRLSDPSK